MKRACALAMGVVALAAPAAATADPTVQTDTSYTQYGIAQARWTSLDTAGRTVKTAIDVLGRRDGANASTATSDAADLRVEQTVCDAGVRHWRRFESHGVHDAVFAPTLEVTATLKGDFTLTGTESSAAGCDAKKPDAGTTRLLGTRKLHLDATWSPTEPAGDGSQLDQPPPPSGGGGGGGGPELPPVPSVPDPNTTCLGALGVSGFSTTGWRGDFTGGASLPLYTPVQWTDVTLGGGGAVLGYGKPTYLVRAGNCS